jgi:hypothetical protein
MHINRVTWDFDAFHDWSQSFERCGVASIDDVDDDLEPLIRSYGEDVADDARRLIEHARAAAGAPATVMRVFIVTELAALRSTRAGVGLHARIDLLDATGALLPWAAFHSAAISSMIGEWPAHRSPERLDEMCDLATRAAAAARDPVAGVAGGVKLQVFACMAWDHLARPILDGSGEPITFASDEALTTFFSASATRS